MGAFAGLGEAFAGLGEAFARSGEAFAGSAAAIVGAAALAKSAAAIVGSAGAGPGGEVILAFLFGGVLAGTNWSAGLALLGGEDLQALAGAGVEGASVLSAKGVGGETGGVATTGSGSADSRLALGGGPAKTKPCPETDEGGGHALPIIRSLAFLATASKASDFGMGIGAHIPLGFAGLGFGGGGRGVGLQTSRFTLPGVAVASCGSTVKESVVKLRL